MRTSLQITFEITINVLSLVLWTTRRMSLPKMTTFKTYRKFHYFELTLQSGSRTWQCQRLYEAWFFHIFYIYLRSLRKEKDVNTENDKFKNFSKILLFNLLYKAKVEPDSSSVSVYMKHASSHRKEKDVATEKHFENLFNE